MKIRFLFQALILMIAFSCNNSGANKQSKKQESFYNQSLYSSEDYDKDESGEEYNYEEEEEEESEDEEKSYEGEYCAEITYYNPNTGRESDYTLTVEVYDNELERINFPNGWLDDDHFGYAEFDEDGYVSFTSDKGYDYTVQIIGESYNCFESVPSAVQCLGLTEEDEQCERLTDNPSGYCWQHEDQE